MKMKNVCAFGAMLGMLATPALYATAWVEAEGNGGNYGGYGNYQAGVGGEFTFATDLSVTQYSPATMDQSGIVPSFQSFCVSETTFSSGTLYYVTFSGQNDRGNPLTAGVAYLYSQFVKQGNFGGYATYDYTDHNGRQASASELQDAIWALMGGQEGQNSVNNAANPFLVAAEAATGGWAGADTAVPAGTDGVSILELWSNPDDTGAAQGQLYVPDGGATMALLGIALSGLAIYRRRA